MSLENVSVEFFLSQEMKTINPLAGKLPNYFIEQSLWKKIVIFWGNVHAIMFNQWINNDERTDSLISNKTHYVSANANAAVWLAVQIMAVFSCFSNSEGDLKTFTV